MAAPVYITNFPAQGSSVNPLSSSSATPGGVKVGIVVDIQYYNPTGGISVDSVDWAGEALIFAITVDSDLTNTTTAIWYKAGPTTTTGAVSVTFSSAPTRSISNATWFSGCHQTSMLGATGSTSGTTSPTDTTLVGTNVDGVQIHSAVILRGTTGSTLTVHLGGVEIHNTTEPGASNATRTVGASAYRASAVGSVTFGFTESINREWGAAVIEILPAPATSLLALLGVG